MTATPLALGVQTAASGPEVGSPGFSRSVNPEPAKAGTPNPTNAAAGGLPNNCCGHNNPVLRVTVGTVAAGAVALGQAALGLGKATPELRDQRRLICAGCEFARGACVAEWLVGWLGDATGRELGCCQKCRCYLWAKTETAAAKCPEGKW